MPESRVTRRAFVVGGLVSATAVGVAGWFGRGGQGAAAARRGAQRFLHVSRLVTGVDDLPEALAPVYLAKLEALDLPMRPSELADLGASATNLGELERAAFRMPGGRECAGQVAAAWWSGFVPVAGGGSEVVTYVDALVWRGMPFARPSSECLGKTGAWAKPGRLAA
jgi:hypothetical protein